MSARERISSLAARAFPRALARYSPYLLIGEPLVDPDGEAFARIDLASRTIRPDASTTHTLELSSDTSIPA